MKNMMYDDYNDDNNDDDDSDNNEISNTDHKQTPKHETPQTSNEIKATKTRAGTPAPKLQKRLRELLQNPRPLLVNMRNVVEKV